MVNRARSDFSARLVEARDAARLTQRQFAEKLGTNRSSVAGWETGLFEPGLQHLSKMATILDVNADWLQNGTGPRSHSLTAQQVLTPEGSLLQIKKQLPRIARALLYMARGLKGAEAWRITSNMLAGTGITQGIYVIVDTERRAQAHDVVVAEVQGVPVFRMYFPPYLYALPLAAAPPPLVVDGVRTVLRGVVAGRLIDE